MRYLLRSFFFGLILVTSLWSFHQKAQAADLTVCAVGCTGTKIGTVLSGAGTGDTITIQGVGVNASNPYNSSADDSWPFTFAAASNTLVCAGGATISQPSASATNNITLSTSSTVSGCTFGNVELTTIGAIGDVGQPPRGFMILNNTFSTTVTSTISFSSSGGTDFVISGNTNVQKLRTVASVSGNGTISNNTFRNIYSNVGSFLVSVHPSTTNLTFTNNTFTNTVSNDATMNAFVSIDGSALTFATNTIRTLTSVPDTGFPVSSLLVGVTGTHNYIGGNNIETVTSTATGGCFGIFIMPRTDISTWVADITLTHNTINLGQTSTCSTTGSSGIMFAPNDSYSDVSLTTTVTYNLIHRGYGLGTSNAIDFNLRSATTTLNTTVDYNGAYGFSDTVSKQIVETRSTLAGTHDVTSYGFLKLDDVDLDNDLELAPFSPYLDVNGTNDIGAYSAVRSSSIDINGGGTIDYITTDATSTYRLADALRSGDTVNFASGNYVGLELSSSAATTSLTFAGAGASLTSLVAATNQDALKLTSVTSTIVSGLTLKSANTVSYAYTTTRVLGAHSPQNYNEASVFLESNAGDMVFFVTTVCEGMPSVVTADGETVTGLNGTSDVHLVLGSEGGDHFTMLVPDNLLPGTGSVYARFQDACGGAILPEYVATSTFTASAGTYTYQSAALASAGITLIDGIATPAISTTATGHAGLHLISSSVIASNVIFDSNNYGLWIGAGSGSSTIINATSTGNTLYDLRHDSASTSTLSDMSFLTASTTFGSTAGFDVYYSGRVRVTDTLGSPLNGVYVSTTPATVGSEASLGTTNGTGYTSYSSLLAHRLNSSSVSLTNAGKNPYTWASGVSSSYIATSTAESLSSPYQTITLAASQRNIGFSASTGSGLESVTATSIRLELSASSLSDVTVDYAVSAGSATGAGTDYTLASGTATITAGDTSTTISIVIVNDSIYEGDETFTIQLSNPTGGAALGTTEYVYTITDNDTAGVTLSESTAAVTEGSTTDSYTVVLDTRPTSTVEILLSVSNAQATLSTSTIAFTTANWFTPVTVTVTATDDSSVEGSHSATITHTASSTNLGYGSGLSVGSVSITITDNDVASSGGGGGGATSFISQPSLPPVVTVVPLPPPIEVTFLDEPSIQTEPVNPTSAEPSPVTPPPAAQSIIAAKTDAQAFGINLSAEDAARIASFIETGSSKETKALGSGERRALLRDAYDTLGKTISNADLERLAKGEIAKARNIEKERTQLPRVRSTFRSIYGHDPNFKNTEENLAWNTLMYRIRFPRDLKAEMNGIKEFKSLFGKDPKDPFQWATVRVMGYVNK